MIEIVAVLTVLVCFCSPYKYRRQYGRLTALVVGS